MGDDQWRPNVPGDIDVVPDDLAGFATMLEEDRALFNSDQAAAINSGFDQEVVAFPSFAGAGIDGRTAGMPQGLDFQLDYGLAWAAMQWFLTEFQQGLMFLELGARNIHMAYGLADALGGDGLANAFERYQDVSVVQDAFGYPTPAPLERENEGDLNLEALEDQASEEFDQIVEDREGLPDTDEDTVSSWGTGDLESRGDQTVHEGQPGELVVPGDTEAMDQHEVLDEHPVPSLHEADD